MTTAALPHPPIASQQNWLSQRLQLLAHEKELTRQYDRVSSERRQLPMVRLEKNYLFEGPDGKISLRNLFAGRTQLIVYHFMYGPDWEKGCPGCTGYVNSLGDLSMLEQRNTTFALVSRAPYAKLGAYKKQQGWTRAWYSSLGSDFNYDFHVTLDEKVAPVSYNYKDKEALAAERGEAPEGEVHGLSVFFRVDDDVFHTYSSYGRGVERLTDSYSLLDATPYGRQEDWESSPAGWPQRPTYGG